MLSGPKLIDRSISFHDPNGEWKNFAYKLYFEAERPGASIRKTEVEIDNSISYFKFIRGNSGIYGVQEDSCFVESGDTDCEAIKRTRNYYVYLWGLPMKLKDPGTNITEEVKEEEFEGETCYVAEVKYTKDTWYFYIRKSDFSMKAYSFITDPNINKGEIIRLEGITQIGAMQIPTSRQWNNTHDGKLLGTDHLVKVEKL